MKRKVIQIAIQPSFVEVDDDGEMGDTFAGESVVVTGRDWHHWDWPTEVRKMVSQVEDRIDAQRVRGAAQQKTRAKVAQAKTKRKPAAKTTRR